MKNESLKIMLSVLAVGILLTGCRSKNEGNGTDNSSDRTTETDQNKEKNVTLTCESINAEIMSPEETNALTEGQIIKAEDCIKIPNDEALETRDLAFIYVYSYSENGSSKEYAFKEPIQKKIPGYEFKRMEILKVNNYFLSLEKIWEKTVLFNEGSVFAGNVISKEKIQKLENEQKQKALK